MADGERSDAGHDPDLERHRAERRIELLSALARDGIIAEFDGACRYVDVWAANERLLARPAAELIGRTIAEALGDAVGRLLTDGARRVFATGNPETFEYTLPLADGPRTFEARMVRIEVEAGPEPYRAAALIRDITGQREVERKLREAERLAALGVLAAGVGHEINNPLMVARENVRCVDAELEAAERAAEGLAAPRVRELRALLQDVVVAVRRMQAVVADLRLFRREDDGARTAVDVRAAMETALDAAQATIEQRAVLERELSPVPPVTATETQLHQVFVNLLVNAAHAVEGGDARAQRIRAVTRTDERGWAIAEIGDTGCGIPPSELARIFEPFFTTKRKGMGLGLSVCQRIVSGCGGSITVESEVGRGTTFRVALPPRAEPADERRPTPRPEQPALVRRRLLVVDDEPAILTVVRRLLGKAHEVATAPGRDAALDLLRRDPRFDCILCDLMMPLGDGMSFYERLGRSWPELQERVVFMTGGAFTPEARTFLSRVPNVTIGKPFDAASLRQVLARITERSSG